MTSVLLSARMVVITMGLGLLFISAGVGQACRSGSCRFSPYDFGTAVGLALLTIGAILGLMVLRSSIRVPSRG